jgi:hypothetical protein
MIILTQSELSAYTSATIDDTVLNQANILINSYVGDIGKQQVSDERISLSGYAKPKLSKVKEYIPLVSVDILKTQLRTPFGLTTETIDTSRVYVDSFGYVDYYPDCGLGQMIFGGTPQTLLVTYTYGYTTAPDDLKLACAIIAQNIAKRGTFGANRVTDFDVTLQFLDDSIITSDVRRVLNKYRGV